jgi:hypothetical protein
MPFLLGDREFSISEATLTAVLPDPYWCNEYNDGEGKALCWAIDVQAAGREIDGHKWAPHAYHESLQMKVRRWHDIAPRAIAWQDEYDDETDEWNGGFYVFEHLGIRQSMLRLKNRRGATFELEWDGRCGVQFDKRYGDDVGFSIRTDVQFTGVKANGSGRDDLRSFQKRLADYLDPGDFFQGEFKSLDYTYESGVGITECLFAPKVDI